MRHAATRFETINENGLNYLEDEMLGDYFEEIIDENLTMGRIEEGPRSGYPNDNFCIWQDGWAEAVREFWREIENQL